MSKIAGLVGILIGGATSAPTHAAGSFGLFPVKSVMVPTSQSQSGQLAAFIDRPAAGQRFAEIFSANFQNNVVSNIAEVERWKTYTVSVQLNRLSQYAVRKPDGTSDIYVAVTATLYFTNIETGQSLFSYSATNYTVKSISGAPDALNAETKRELVDSAFTDALTNLVDKAAKRFNPYSRNYTIKGRAYGAFILDAGLDGGLQIGDELLEPKGSSISVVYAADHYAIAQPQLGKIDPGATFTKISNSTLASVRKPSLIVSSEIADDAHDAASIAQQLTDAMGDASPFAVLNYTSQFAEVVDFVSKNTGISNSRLQSRRPPDYFAHIIIHRAHFSTVTTNLDYKTIRTVDQPVSLSILDRNGRIIYADSTSAHISDEVVSNIGFDRTARVEVALRNALVTLAERVNERLRFQKLRLKVGKVGENGIALVDPGEDLRPGTPLNILSLVDRADSSTANDIYVPTWSAHVVDETNGIAQKDLPILAGAPQVREGNLAELVSEATKVGGTQRQYSLCEHVAGLGDVDPEGFDGAALSALVASGFRNIRAAERVSGTIKILNASGVFSLLADPQQGSAQNCFQPVNRILLGPRECDGAKGCRLPLTVTVGFRLKRGEETLYRLALDQKAVSSAFPSDTSDDDARQIIMVDAEKISAALISQLASEKQFQDSVRQY